MKKSFKLITLIAVLVVAVMGFTACTMPSWWPSWLGGDKSIEKTVDNEPGDEEPEPDPTPIPSQLISSLEVGTLVCDNNTKYGGEVIIWQIADFDHAGYPDDSVTLISEKLLTAHCFDAKEPTNPTTKFKNEGGEGWRMSNIRQWLNSTAGEGLWYSAQHEYDAPPTEANLSGGRAYDNEAGFLNGFSQWFKGALIQTSYNLIISEVLGGGNEDVSDKIFLASKKEVDSGYATTFPIFSGGASFCKPSPTQYFLDYVKDTGYTYSDSIRWWLRDIYSTWSSSVISENGMPGNAVSAIGHWGVRPVCNLSKSTLVSEEPDENGIYRIVY